MALDLLAEQVPDPKLRARLTPNYQFGCKRVLISNDFYPAIQRPNVEFVTDGIREIREHSIVTRRRHGASGRRADLCHRLSRHRTAA